jgi:hypothetical protein
METKITRDNIVKHLLEYELSLSNKTLIDVFNDFDWRFNFTITNEQNEKFEIYAIKLYKKIYRCNSLKAKEFLNWFKLGYSLRIKN